MTLNQDKRYCNSVHAKKSSKKTTFKNLKIESLQNNKKSNEYQNKKNKFCIFIDIFHSNRKY